MMRLAPIVEAKALEYARQLIVMDPSWFNKADNRQFVLQMMKELALSDASRMMAFAEYARAGWGVAQEALQELIAEFSVRGEQLPMNLAAYNAEFARGGFKRLPGQQKSDYALRDIAIMTIVGRVSEKFSLKPMRGKTRRRPSGCSVVAAALSEERLAMGEKAAEAIWLKYGPACFPHLARES